MKLNVYSAAWCGACQTLKQTLNTISTDDLEIQVIDIDALGMQELSKVGIKGIPSIILCDDQGNELKRKSGSLTKKQLQDFLGL